MVTISSGDVAAHGLQLTPGQTTSVQVDQADYVTASVEILTDGSTDVWYTLDGSTPTVGSPRTYRIPAGAAGVDSRTLTGVRELKVTASAATTVSVQRSS